MKWILFVFIVVLILVLRPYLRLYYWRWRARRERKTHRRLLALANWQAIEILRSSEADSVTIAADNADFGGPNNLVICNGSWTNYEDRYFYGKDVHEALNNAVKARHPDWR